MTFQYSHLLWSTFVNSFLQRFLIWQGISFQSFMPKRDKEFLWISSFEHLTWKLPEVDDHVWYEWIVEVFSNKFKRFVGELLLLISPIRLAAVFMTLVICQWPSTDTFTFTEISYGTTAKALDGLNPSKYTGTDLIPPRILKLAAKELAPSLTKIFNLSITCGYYPKRWKRGDWVPVFKKDDKMERKNYRPVTVLNAVNKVFEQLLSKQVVTKVD